jgi:hypothetical protein
MPKAKKKLLPKEFEALLAKGKLDALKAVFDTCEVDARGGYTKHTALAFDECPHALAKWLVEQGADLAAADTYGATPLHARAASWQGNIGSLIELGADVNHNAGQRGTPLHMAAGAHKAENTSILLAHGAKVEVKNAAGETPLAHALARCNNIDIENMAELAEALLAAGAKVTKEMKAAVVRIGTEFEFHRSAFAADSVDATSKALTRLYELLEVPPVPRRAVHDGKRPIVAKKKRWQDAHQELWELLVPSMGCAATVQGEVIRIAGRIHDELERNGGLNWDAHYKKMADAFLAHVGSGKPLPAAALGQAKALVATVKKKQGDSVQLMELAVAWVALNPKPVPLPEPDYKR